MVRHRPASLPRSLIAALLSVAAAAMAWAYGLTERLDYLFYDSFHAVLERPTAPDIAIVAVDDASLGQIGRWPWSRRIHARLLNRLTDAGVRAVAFDILFAEAEVGDPGADRMLAEAIARHGRVILAVAPEIGPGSTVRGEILPIPQLAAAAAGLGHTDFELDADGICRSQYLYAGAGDPHWRALALALHQSNFDNDRDRRTGRSVLDPVGWIRDTPMLIPFAGPPGHFRRYSYVDVLHGSVPAEHLRGRAVFIGSTAAGVGDLIATPRSGDRTRMPGVELNANVLLALNEGIEVRPLDPVLHVGIIVLTILLPAVSQRWLAPGYAPVTFTVAGLIVVGASVLALAQGPVWFSPAPAILGLIPGYALWNWLHLRSFHGWLREFGHLIPDQVHRDPTTGLPTREHLLIRTARMIAEGGNGESFAMVVLHCERLQGAFDRLGAELGKRLALQVSARLRSVAREHDFVARLDREEFALVVSQPTDHLFGATFCQRVVEAFERPFELDGNRMKLPATLGLAMFPDDAATASELLDNAHAALSRAGILPQARYCLFSDDIRQERIARARLDHDLEQALHRGEFALHYQPQVNASNGRIIGFEALLRWNNPHLGSMAPDRFVPAAERSGLIVPIGDWVLEQACAQAQLWARNGLGDVWIAVNVSGVQLIQPGLAERVAGVLRRTGLPPRLLELELTETILMHNLGETLDTLHQLKRLGVRLAVDDFGTGYSSLGYLQRFPLDRVKIDRVFISEIGVRPESEDITRAIVDMAHRLRLKVVAEGVENPGQREFLRSEGCDEIQGFLLARPMPAEDATKLLAARRSEQGSPGIPGWEG
jgi:diguanylate cyclase (GGDEF)-like protein